MAKPPFKPQIGKLLTGKGPIPGELGAFGDVWGKISATGDEAERMMGFRPKEGAIGVVLSRRKYTDKNGKVKKGIFATSLMPRKKTDTEKKKATDEKMRIIVHIAKKYHDDLIVSIWNPLIKNDRKKPYTGHHYFMSRNLKSVGLALKWKKLLISNGTLKVSHCLSPHWYDPDTNEIKICIPLTINKRPLTVTQIGIGIIDIITGDFFHISPDSINSMNSTNSINSKTWNLENIRKNYKPKGQTSYKYYSRFYIYIYHRKQKLSFACPPNTFFGRRGFRHSPFSYSPSICRRILTYKDRVACYPGASKRKMSENLITIKIKP